MMLVKGEEGTGLMYNGKPRSCGFWLSLSDLLVLAGSFLATWFFWKATHGYSFFILFVVGHFFLFCNVFRLRRKPELIWTAGFVFNTFLFSFFDYNYLVALLAVQVTITVALIGLEMARPDYHGIFSKKINSSIKDYLSGKI